MMPTSGRKKNPHVNSVRVFYRLVKIGRAGQGHLRVLGAGAVHGGGRLIPHCQVKDIFLFSTRYRS
jgi:hypothetical protein